MMSLVLPDGYLLTHLPIDNYVENQDKLIFRCGKTTNTNDHQVPTAESSRGSLPAVGRCNNPWADLLPSN